MTFTSGYVQTVPQDELPATATTTTTMSEEQWAEIRKAMEEFNAEQQRMQPMYPAWPCQPAQTCPHCGRCSGCGRGGSLFQPYPNPWSGPYYTYTSGDSTLYK